MKYVAAYALLTLAGKKDITAADLSTFLTKVGASVEDSSLELVVTALKGKQLHEVIAQGLPKIASLSVGGGGSAPAQAGGAPAKGAPAQAAPKEEAPPVEEEAVSMGGLFD